MSDGMVGRVDSFDIDDSCIKVEIPFNFNSSGFICVRIEYIIY